MGVTLLDAVGAIEAFAPLALAEPWDNPGLQVGDPGAGVKRVLVALDPSPRAAAEACRRRADLLVTHHPLLLHPLDRIDTSTTTGSIVARLLGSGVGLYAAHTNLDRAQGGVNDALAEQLGLADVRPLGPHPGAEPAGPSTSQATLGRLGRLPEARPLGKWAREAARRLGAEGARVVGDLDRSVELVAVCGGSGADLWGEAWRAGAQTLVTGDVKYHTALEAAAAGFSMIDVGHGPSERRAVQVLAGVLRAWSEAEAPGVHVEEFDEADPFGWVLP